ncbi:MAG: sigma factor-like helix-turn-helix DNA-binding protein, partial [Pseudobdellovibrionaceae bacterium]
KTHLFGILLNKIREYRRKIKKIDYKEDSEEIFSASFTNEGWWAQDPGDPEKIFKNKQLGLAIEDCLEGLSEVQKSAFMLIESEGESTEEACNILGVTCTHLRVLIFRAKNKLKTCLEGRVA